MSGFFPSLQPSISNNLWFDLKGGSVVEDDLKLLKEETKFNEQTKKEVNEGNNITPIGQAKQKTEDIGNFLYINCIVRDFDLLMNCTLKLYRRNSVYLNKIFFTIEWFNIK